ncbi:LacI family DNA-binding transcriptional regulator [Novosphingobium kaempferiae]|uniref:LacI family DNA-binding transcriptional regulator n=1 Tax=Novosphingobium kaempferiae TaxID=2896849 RepID=UPI001E5EF4A5|nr:LacI family DNA-binding transcriptional regulator [Novosphingobium kaempferiae]
MPDKTKTREKTAKASRRQREAPTISDVAEHAGVSPMTVSRVINNRTTVRESTRERVERSIEALNYAPSVAARALAGGEEMRLGLLYSNPSSSYLSEFLVGGLDQASRNNAHLVVEQFDEGWSVEELVRHLQRGRLNGIVLPPPLCDSPEMVEALQVAGIPAVSVAGGYAFEESAIVGIDDFHAAGEMTRHLIALGHVRIGFIRGNPNQRASERRYEGYVSALSEAGLELDPALVTQGFFTYRSGLDAAEQILDLAEPPTAIFASNDDMAAATVAVAHRRGLDVPGDLTVCGFDDTLLATTIWPELTTIRQPISDMARAAIDLIVQRLRGDRRDGAKMAKVDAHGHVLLDYALIRRQSDAAPRRRPRPRPRRQEGAAA